MHQAPPLLISRLPDLCSGQVERLRRWAGGERRAFLLCFLALVVGAGMYGWVFGRWRSPMQGVYTAIKFPLLMALVTLGNALINGITAQVLGLQIRFRESSMAILISFAVASIILGALAPVSLFVLMNTPPEGTRASGAAYSFLLIFHVFVVGLAGVIGNLRMFNLLRSYADEAGGALRVLGAWLFVNALLGTQLAWIFRPFAGSPGLPVEFFRANALEGNFYEAVWYSLSHLFR